MIQKLRAYINRSFENVPKTKKSIEMQEELIANLIEKYYDQCAQGKTEEEEIKNRKYEIILLPIITFIPFYRLWKLFTKKRFNSNP